MKLSKINKIIVDLSIGFVITFLMAGLLYLKLSPLEVFEAKLYDYRVKMRGQLPSDEKVVIAAIDEKSIEKLGRWPWSRDKIAELVNKLNAAGAEIIVFDVIFSETEANDPQLAAAINDAGNVVLPIVFQFDKKSPASTASDPRLKHASASTRGLNPFKGQAEEDILASASYASVINTDMFEKYSPIAAGGVLSPVPALIKEAAGLGHINMFPDNDGTLRWEALVIGYDGNVYPSAPLKAASMYLGVPRGNIVLNATEGVQLGKRYLPTDRFGRMLINYYGKNQTFKHISISDIIDGSAAPKDLAGKVVLIGATAVGIYDLRVTPLSPAMPGIEKHASVIESVIDNRLIRKAPPFTDFMVLMASGIIFSVLVIRFKAVGATALAAGCLAAVFLSGYHVFAGYGLWMNIAYPAVNIILIFVSVTAYNFAVEERRSKKMKNMFSSYVTKRVVEELIKNPEMAKLGGARKELTILFSDVRGFTSFSEKHSPEEVVAILNEYLGAMTEVVFKWEGTLDKFIGDAIMVFWGAPMPQENHAELAVRCALHMGKRLDELRQKWQAEGKPLLDCGIGINTGEVIVGNIGADGKKMDYTIIGDHVNLCSRVEGLTKKFGAHLLITEFTLSKIRKFVNIGAIGHVSITGLENVVVKGKEVPVGIYEVLSLSPELESKIVEAGHGEAVVMDEK
ncbi:MAG: adenylate/guanylate cyclase domain-containing protein [Deltaproteobacteria bacterium]|nr:adenylate/guanylate cyclase domain-containing protein [Deltaproteobacteria bacterium]